MRVDLADPILFRAVEDQKEIARLERKAESATRAHENTLRAIKVANTRRIAAEHEIAKLHRLLDECRVQRLALQEQHRHDKELLFVYRYGSDPNGAREASDPNSAEVEALQAHIRQLEETATQMAQARLQRGAALAGLSSTWAWPLDEGAPEESDERTLAAQVSDPNSGRGDPFPFPPKFGPSETTH
jgi:septal ring factor EnvC (AmiA/AmiB activator)